MNTKAPRKESLDLIGPRENMNLPCGGRKSQRSARQNMELGSMTSNAVHRKGVPMGKWRSDVKGRGGRREGETGRSARRCIFLDSTLSLK